MNRNFREHKSISSVIRYLEAIENARRDFFKPATRRGKDDPIWFRGQHRISWSLTPKLYRPEFLETDRDEVYVLEAETRDLFQSRARHLVHDRHLVDKWEWYFLMQHYGAPTRLFDWSENPLIALYFAVKNHNCKENAVVWLLDPYWLNKQNTRLSVKV